MKHEAKQKLQIRERRIFSEELKKKAVKDLTSKRTTIKALMSEHQVSATDSLQLVVQVFAVT